MSLTKLPSSLRFCNLTGGKGASPLIKLGSFLLQVLVEPRPSEPLILGSAVISGEVSGSKLREGLQILEKEARRVEKKPAGRVSRERPMEIGWG